MIAGYECRRELVAIELLNRSPIRIDQHPHHQEAAQRINEQPRPRGLVGLDHRIGAHKSTRSNETGIPGRQQQPVELPDVLAPVRRVALRYRSAWNQLFSKFEQARNLILSEVVEVRFEALAYRIGQHVPGRLLRFEPAVYGPQELLLIEILDPRKRDRWKCAAHCRVVALGIDIAVQPAFRVQGPLPDVLARSGLQVRACLWRQVFQRVVQMPGKLAMEWPELAPVGRALASASTCCLRWLTPPAASGNSMKS